MKVKYRHPLTIGLVIILALGAGYFELLRALDSGSLLDYSLVAILLIIALTYSAKLLKRAYRRISRG